MNKLALPSPLKLSAALVPTMFSTPASVGLRTAADRVNCTGQVVYNRSSAAIVGGVDTTAAVQLIVAKPAIKRVVISIAVQHVVV